MSTPSVADQIATLVEAEVARAMAPYRLLDLRADELDEMEQILRFGLATHPAAQAYLRLIVGEVVTASSDIRSTGGIADLLKKREGA